MVSIRHIAGDRKWLNTVTIRKGFGTIAVYQDRLSSFPGTLGGLHLFNRNYFIYNPKL